MYSVIFIAAFFGFEFFAIEHTEGLAMLFQLPDTWVFLGTSALLIWWAASRYVHRSAA
jgi:hypothetical protein